MVILATVNFDDSNKIFWAILPLIAIMVALYWYEKYADIPKLESLNSAQKTWLFLRSIDPSLAAKVFMALGSEVAWSYLKRIENLAPQSVGLTNKVCDEFCNKVNNFSTLKTSAIYATSADFLADKYHGDGALLASDLCKVWPLEDSLAPELEETVQTEVGAEDKTGLSAS